MSKLNKYFPNEPSEMGKLFNEATDDGLQKLLADLAKRGDSNISLAAEDQDGSLDGGGGGFAQPVPSGADLNQLLENPELKALLGSLGGGLEGAPQKKGMPLPKGKPVELQIKEAKLKLLNKPGQLLKGLKK